MRTRGSPPFMGSLHLVIHSYLDPSVKLSHYQIPALEMYEAESGYVMTQFSWLVTNATFFVYGR